MTLSYANYIDGSWVPTASGQTFTSYNPATGAALGVVTCSNAADAAAAAAAAARAYPAWRNTPAPQRGAILFRAGEILVRRKDELARMMTMEMGKVIKEAAGDVQEAIDMCYYMAGEGRRSFGYTTPSELPNKFAMAVRDPIGVVAAITPWNFPLAIPGWKIFPALVLGNTVVYKPSCETAMVSSMIVNILEQAGLPPGVLNLVQGPGATVGKALAADRNVNLVSFTGSTEVGRQLLIETAPLMKRISLELGGKNAIIVLDDADVELAVDGILWSAFGTTGQRCTAASRVIVQRGIRDRLVSALVERTRKLTLGNGLDPATDVGPVINQTQLEKIERYVKIGQEEGAKLLVGGHRATAGELANGYFFEPTIFDHVQPGMRIAQEEIFGPVTALITVDTLAQAIEVNNGVAFGLSSAIFTRNVNQAFTALRDLTTGLVYVNAGTIGAEVHLPFGGTRGTGNGHREAGIAALDVFSEWQTLFVDYSGKLQRAQIDVA
jgi:acyl-CoA reductase-like NAD-dependent aldehyde dehydrogenase